MGKKISLTFINHLILMNTIVLVTCMNISAVPPKWYGSADCAQRER